MATKNDKLKDALGSFKGFLKETFADLRNDFNLEDEYVSNIISQSIVASINGSISLVKVEKENELIDKQIVTEVERTKNVTSDTKEKDERYNVLVAQKGLIGSQKTTEDKKALDLVEATKIKTEQILLLKEQKYMQGATRLRQQGVSVDANGTLTLLTDGKSIAEKNIKLLEEQAKKVIADTTQTTTQTDLMKKQVLHNCLIQGMKQASDYTLALATGSLVPDDKMHVNFFVQNKALFHHAGASIDGNGNVTIADPNNTGAVLTLGTFDTDVTVTEASA